MCSDLDHPLFRQSIEGASVLKYINWLKLKIAPAQTSLGIIFLAFAGILILFPLVELLLTTFQVLERDVGRVGLPAGDWTLFYWHRAFISEFSRNVLYEPFRNTVVVSAAYTFLAMTIGVTLAFLMVKTDLPFKKFFKPILLIPYIIPSWTIALAWVILFRHTDIGLGVPGVLQWFSGIQVPEWVVYGPVPITIVLSLNYFAFTYLLCSAALTNMDGSLEEAAVTQGVSNLGLLRRVTLPLILPAITSAFVLTFAMGMGQFGVPAFLGFPVRFNMLATALFGAVGLGRYGDAYVLSIVLIVTSMSIVYANRYLIGKRRQYTTIGGKGGRRRVIHLGKWRTPITVLVGGFALITAIVPMGLLIMESFMYTLGQFSLDNFTTGYWIGHIDGFDGVLVDWRVGRAARNSVTVGLSVATITAVIGVAIGYVLSRGRGSRLTSVVDQVSFLPYVIPGIAFGAVYISMFARSRGIIPSLYGTLGIIILAAVVNRMPLAVRTGSTAMMQISPSLEEAARLHGAGFGRRFVKVLFPLSKNGFLAGFILSFISTIKDLSLVVLLVTPTTMVLPVMTLNYVDIGRRQFADAVAIIIVIIVLSGSAIAARIAGVKDQTQST